MKTLTERIAEVEAALKKFMADANAQINFLNGKKQALEELLKEEQAAQSDLVNHVNENCQDGSDM